MTEANFLAGVLIVLLAVMTIALFAMMLHGGFAERRKEKERRAEAKENNRQQIEARWRAVSDVTDDGIYELKIALISPNGTRYKAIEQMRFPVNDERFNIDRAVLFGEAEALASDLNAELDKQY